VFNTRVERALAERAIGFYVDVEEVFVIDKKLEKKIVRKYYPPDTMKQFGVTSESTAAGSGVQA
jgi:hypothetical protein